MGELIQLTPENTDEAAKKAASVLRAGGVVLYPTDTLYGLGVDSLHRDALEKIYSIKGRDKTYPLPSIIMDLEHAAAYAEVIPLARILAKEFLPGPLTLWLAKKETVPDWATAGKETFSIRIPNNDFCLALAREFKKPYTTTSANKSDEPTQNSVNAILDQLGNAAEDIDLIIDAGELPTNLPSTVVDARGAEPIIMREGAISAEEIFTALQM